VSQFEFMSVVIAILLGLAITRVIESLPDCFARGRFYWIHAAWVVGKLLHGFMLFWIYWTARSAYESASYSDFMLGLIVPTVFALQVSTMVTRAPEGVANWRSHFWSIRKWFFAANAVIPIANLGNAFIQNLAAPTNIAIFSVLIGLSTAGFLSRNERVHALVVVTWLVTMVAGAGALFLASPT